MQFELYVKLEDVLALIPNDDIVGPKPSYLRKKINELPTLISVKDVPMSTTDFNKLMSMREDYCLCSNQE